MYGFENLNFPDSDRQEDLLFETKDYHNSGERDQTLDRDQDGLEERRVRLDWVSLSNSLVLCVFKYI